MSETKGKKRRSSEVTVEKKKKKEKKEDDDVMEVTESKEEGSKGKSDSKSKKRRTSEVVKKEGEESNDQILLLSPISSPLANAKLTSKLFTLVKTASKEKKLRRGVKEVVKAIRKNEKGLCVLAGDVSPIDVISHLPVLCEESEISYVYVPSKEKLGTAASTRRPTSVVLISNKNLSSDSKLNSKLQRTMAKVKLLSPSS
eukprot:TRINITY_DN8198_c0_g1_i1.p1 TRINITY_DN8198_c0_g1~~TRINITY_DN8198_c0_g1_i1.p1  ORF type:complete len:227 (-),score=72.45 TRINITY_DN8198_c0_g1_i1:68-667(-)